MEQIKFAKQKNDVWISPRAWGDIDYKQRNNWNSKNRIQRERANLLLSRVEQSIYNIANDILVPTGIDNEYITEISDGIGRIVFEYTYDSNGTVNVIVNDFIWDYKRNPNSWWYIVEQKNCPNTQYKTNPKNRLTESDLRRIISECVHKGLKRCLKNSVLNENTKLRSKPKCIIRLTEGDLCHIVKNCINEALLLENRESKSIKQTEKIIVSLFQNTYGDRLFQTVTDDQGQPILTQRGDEQTMLQYLERHVRATFFHNDYANIKFEPGIARIAYGELGMQANEDRQSLHKLGGILKILSQAHSDEYDSNLNGMSFIDLDNRFGKSALDMGKEEQDRINNAEYNGNGDYTIVRINSFEEAKPFYKYTNPKSRWCLTHMKKMFDQYTNNGNNTLYFAYKNGFENIKPIESEGCPLDEYGLSLLSIIMSPDYGDGSCLAYCTCRWNHGNGGSDSVMDAQELSNVLGGSVFKLCPSRKIEINIDGDLGLPSGTIWMTKNVGAKSETDYGKYFAWGMKKGFYGNEIDDDMISDEWYKQQEIVDWSNFRFEDGSYAPSDEQLKELQENCTYSFMN